jgi:hypothetical protein
MLSAMKIFKEFLSGYKERKKEEDSLYPFLELDIVKKFEKLAEEY